MREQLASIWRDLEEYICCTLLGVIMTLLMMQVCYRYFGGKSIAWSEEVSRFLFLYLVYFAASSPLQRTCISASRRISTSRMTWWTPTRRNSPTGKRCSGRTIRCGDSVTSPT